MTTEPIPELEPDPGTDSPVVGIIGAGKSGTAIARLALAAGYPVRIAASGPAEETAMMTAIVAPGVVAGTVAEVIDGADIVILAVPLRQFPELPLSRLEDRVVVDAMNYWPPIDGILPAYENTDRPSSLVVRDALPATVRLVKTFNHLGYHQLEDLPRPRGATDRAALAISGDDPDAVAVVADLVDRLGFDPVPAGTLAGSHAVQPDSAIFGTGLDATGMQRHLADDQQPDRAA
jgi:8-hydroxy-5-deazaflavin:NADPH oxidoreductase